MVYSDSYKFIYYAVPKTGSRSVQDYLKKYGVCTPSGWSPNHDNYEEVKQELGEEKSKTYLKFAFFRSPWSFLISVYFFNRLKNNLPPHKKAVIEWLNTYREDTFAPYIFDKEGNVILDFIGKLENIKEDLHAICEILHIPVPEKIAHIGKQSVRGKIEYRGYYDDPVLRDKVRNIFSRSNNILRYEF